MTEDERRIDSRAFGALEQAVKHLTDTWKMQDHEATVGRRQLYDKFDELKDLVISELNVVRLSVGNLGHRVDTVVLRIEKIEPQLTSSSNEHQQRIGSRKAVAKLWGIVLGALTAAGTIGAGIAALIHALLPTKPPLH